MFRGACRFPKPPVEGKTGKKKKCFSVNAREETPDGLVTGTIAFIDGNFTFKAYSGEMYDPTSWKLEELQDQYGIYADDN